MQKAPSNYTIDQAFNDIIYLGTRQRTLENCLEEWTEFITAEFFKHNIDKRHDFNRYFKEHVRGKFKELEENNKGLTKYLHEKIEELYTKTKGKEEKPTGEVPMEFEDDTKQT